MPTKNPYSATLPLGGDAGKPLGDDNILGKIFPYFVAVGVTEDWGFVAVIGALLHVAAWVMGFIFDILVMQGLDKDKGSADAGYVDAQLYDYWIFGFIPLCIGFGIVVLGIVYHWVSQMNNNSLEEFSGSNRLAPSAELLVEAGALISTVFTFIIAQMDQSTLYGLRACDDPTRATSESVCSYPDPQSGDVANKHDPGDLAKNFRACVALSLACKLIIYSALKVNKIEN